MSDVVIQTNALTKRYGRVLAVDRLSLEVPRGHVFGLLGPNGAGKTTVMGMLLGLVRPTSGSFSLLGTNGTGRDALRRIGAIVETPAFYPYLSGRRNLAYFQGVMGRNDSRELDRLLELVGLAGRANDAFKTYSLGMKQRLGLAYALLGDPELLLLDEPTNGMDPAGMAEVRDLIRDLGSEGRTILLSSHLLNEVEQVCDGVAIIARGRLVVQGDVADLLRPQEQVRLRTTDDARALAILTASDEVEAARQALFVCRESRVRPGLDDKVLTEWNGLMLSALAEAAAATGDPQWRDAAVANGEFLVANLRRDDGRWLRSWQAGDAERPAQARHLAYAQDYGALIDAFTRLGELSGEARWIDEARAAADGLLELFWDGDGGGVFTTGNDAERLVTRPKDLMDNATPSAQSLAACGLLRLAALTGESRYLDRAHETVALFGPAAPQHPTAFGRALDAIDMAANGLDEIAVVGDRADLVAAVQTRYLPGAVLAWGEPYDSPLWADRPEGFAYVCRDFACQSPAATVEELIARLEA